MIGTNQVFSGCSRQKSLYRPKQVSKETSKVFFLKNKLCKQRTIKGEKSINYIFSIFDFLELVELESLKYPREDIISVLAWKRQVFASWQITSFVASSPMDNFHGTRNNILSQIIQFLEFRRDFNLDITVV